MSALAKNVRDYDQRNLALSKDGFNVSRLLLGIIDESTRAHSSPPVDPNRLLEDLFASGEAEAPNRPPENALLGFGPPLLDPRVASAQVSVPAAGSEEELFESEDSLSNSKVSAEFGSDDLEEDDEMDLETSRTHELRGRSQRSEEQAPRRSSRLKHGPEGFAFSSPFVKIY